MKILRLARPDACNARVLYSSSVASLVASFVDGQSSGSLCWRCCSQWRGTVFRFHGPPPPLLLASMVGLALVVDDYIRQPGLGISMQVSHAAKVDHCMSGISISKFDEHTNRESKQQNLSFF